jgi:hypothetical protein
MISHSIPAFVSATNAVRLNTGDPPLYIASNDLNESSLEIYSPFVIIKQSKTASEYDDS